MNILILSEYGLYCDFSFSFVHAQAKAYAALGHRVRVVIPIAFGKRDWEGRRFSARPRMEDGVDLRPLRHVSISNFGEGGFNDASASAAVTLRWQQLMEGFSADIIQVHHTLGFNKQIGAFFKRRLNVPLVITAHGFSSSAPPAGQKSTAKLKQFCDQADQVVVVSSALAEKLRPCGTSTPISVILNGFAVEALPPQRKENSCSLIQVGSLTRQKRVYITLQAFSRLHRKWPETVLTIVGQGPEADALKSLVEELGLSRAVRFTGQLPNPEVLAEMAMARFFVMPSVREGFGIVYLEAMACGCITIGTGGEGIADLIVSGENGFLVPPDDPEAIVRTVEWCFAHPLEAAAIAERGRQDALGLTWKKNAEQYICLFHALTERNHLV